MDRWYAPRHSIVELTPGEHTVTVRLDDDWGSVLMAPGASKTDTCQDAIDNADRVGFVLSSLSTGLGHGVYATGPARLTVLSFHVT